jgi:hypothetical protein
VGSEKNTVSIHRTPLAQLTWDSVADFCQQQVAENTVLDYKQQMPNDIEKSVAAMANTLGGLILIGVPEDGHAKPVLPMVGMAVSRGVVEQVMSKCVSNITPLVVPEVTECLNAVGDRMVVVVRVAPSPEAPHAISRNTLVYVRTGRQSDPEELASIERIEWILRRREKLEAFRDWLIRRASDRYNSLRAGRVPDIAASKEHDAAKCLLTLSVCPYYPDPEPLVRAPELRRIRSDIYVRDPLGTANQFPLDEGISARSVEDGIIMHIPGEGGLRTYHTHLNMHGLYFYKQSLLWQPNRRDGVGELPPPAMRFVEIVARLLSLLHSADKFYKKLGYNGPLSIHLKLESFDGIALLASNLVENEYYRRFSADSVIEAETTTTTYDLVQDRGAIALELVQRVAWAFDHDVSIQNITEYAAKSFR